MLLPLSRLLLALRLYIQYATPFKKLDALLSPHSHLTATYISVLFRGFGPNALLLKFYFVHLPAQKDLGPP